MSTLDQILDNDVGLEDLNIKMYYDYAQDPLEIEPAKPEVYLLTTDSTLGGKAETKATAEVTTTKRADPKETIEAKAKKYEIPDSFGKSSGGLTFDSTGKATEVKEKASSSSKPAAGSATYQSARPSDYYNQKDQRSAYGSTGTTSANSTNSFAELFGLSGVGSAATAPLHIGLDSIFLTAKIGRIISSSPKHQRKIRRKKRALHHAVFPPNSEFRMKVAKTSVILGALSLMVISAESKRLAIIADELIRKGVR